VLAVCWEGWTGGRRMAEEGCGRQELKRWCVNAGVLWRRLAGWRWRWRWSSAVPLPPCSTTEGGAAAARQRAGGGSCRRPGCSAGRGRRAGGYKLAGLGLAAGEEGLLHGGVLDKPGVRVLP
jgi:hypothetical protein